VKLTKKDYIIQEIKEELTNHYTDIGQRSYDSILDKLEELKQPCTNTLSEEI